MMKYNYSASLFFLILSLLSSADSFSNTSENKVPKSMVVIIDPGHGGKDPGAVSKGIREKDAVLGIGLKLGSLISENFPDVKVIFTRNSDVFIPLIDRSRIANKNKADLFISIHANFCGTPSTRGTETYFLGEARSGENLDVAKKENSVILMEDNYKTTYENFDPNSSESYIMFATIQGAYLDQSLSFANDIQRQFGSKLESSNRGVKQAGFLVLRESSMPSVLVETGFISNPSEAQYLKSEAGQLTIARSILEAFRKFKGKSFEPNNLVIAKAENSKKSKESAVTTNDSVQKNKKSIHSQDSFPKEKSVAIESKNEIEPVSESVHTSTLDQKADIKKSTISEKNEIEQNQNEYFSVQIAASITSVEPVAANFKGLKNVRSEKKEDKYYRYFVGKEASVEKITPLLNQIKQKYPQAFIVSFVAGKRIAINTSK